MYSTSVGGFSSQLEILVGQDAHLVAGAPHQGRLDLIVAEDVAAQEAMAGQRRKWQCRLNGAIRTMALWPQ